MLYSLDISLLIEHPITKYDLQWQGFAVINKFSGHLGDVCK